MSVPFSDCSQISSMSEKSSKEHERQILIVHTVCLALLWWLTVCLALLWGTVGLAKLRAHFGWHYNGRNVGQDEFYFKQLNRIIQTKLLLCFA